MLKISAVVLLLGLCAVAQDQPKCLVVYPMMANLGGQPVRCLGCRTRYFYAGSIALPIKDVKDRYSKKEVEKLEKAGVKIVTAPAPDGLNVRLNSIPAQDTTAVKQACSQ